MELKDIKELIEFDHDTMQAVIDIHSKKETTIKEIALEKDEIYKSSWEAVNKQVEETKKKLDEKIASDAALNEKKYNEMSSLITSTFQSSNEQWKKELVDRTSK